MDLTPFNFWLQIFEWILQAKMFKPDVGCFNMLMDAYGRNKQWAEAEKTFHLMKSFQCVPTEISFNVLMAAFSRGGQLEKAEALFDEMKESNYAPGIVHTLNCVVYFTSKFLSAINLFLPLVTIRMLAICSLSCFVA